ncbi:DUF1542 domain-containing protein [Apilactobacillus xinyiensis]|uniref:DUF1542 domain-containing protein n=1 Tax=Apilactobacillus xinyiensis TaxID=2841032 RepID=UPI001C7D2A34|nr:DUF1542 domain-containing protein [Apilactobacillus xinyiensis]
MNKKIKMYASLLSIIAASTGAIAVAPQVVRADPNTVNANSDASSSTFAIRRIDGLTVGSNRVSLYVPGARNFPGTIYAIGVKRPDQSSYMWWSSGIDESNDGTIFSVSFTNPTNQIFVSSPFNVGKKMTFVVQFQVNGKNIQSDAYSKPLDNTIVMTSKTAAKSLLDVLSPFIGNDAVQDGKNDIEDSTTLTGIAQATINAIFRSFDKMSDDFNAKIDGMSNLSDNDKNDLKKQFANKISAAKSKLNGTTSINDITSAFNDVKSGYDDLLNQAKNNSDSNLSGQKQKQIKALDDELSSKKSQIDKMSLSDDLKNAAKQEFQSIHDRAVEQVNNSNTLKDIDSAGVGGTNDLDNAFRKINSKHENIRASRDLYKRTLSDKAAQLNTQIDNLTNLSDTKKAEYKNQINKELSVGTNEIDKESDDSKFSGLATTYSKNMQDLFDGIKTNHDNGLNNEKLTATSQNSKLQQTHDNLVKQLDNLGNLTKDQKDALTKQLDNALNDAVTSVKNAANSNQIDKAVNDGIDNMNNIFKDTKTNHDANLQTYKDSQIDELNNSASQGKKIIDSLTNLSDADKNIMKSTIDAKLNTVIASVEAANGNTAVDATVAAGKKDMDDYVNSQKSNHDQGLQKSKDLANNQLDSQASAIKAKIDGLTNLSDSDKQAAKDTVDGEINKAKQLISNSKTSKDISDNLATNAKSLDDQFNTLKNKHDQQLAANIATATGDLNAKRDNLLKMLNDLTNLSDNQKQDIIKNLNADFENAKKNINQSKNNSDIAKAKNDGIQALENDYQSNKKTHDDNLQKDKNNAIASLKSVVSNQIDKVNGMTNLSDLDKKAMVDRINADQDDKILAINRALTTNSASSIGTNAQNMITNYVANKDKIQKENLRHTKSLVNKALDSQLKDLQDQVDALTNLSPADKSKIKSTLAKQVLDNQDNINNLDNENNVNAAYDSQKQILQNMFNDVKDSHDKTLQNSKNNAIAKLQNEYDSLNDEIDSLTNLSDGQRSSLINQLSKKFNDYQNKISQDNNDNDINSDNDQGISDMDNIFNTVKAGHDRDLANDKQNDKSKVNSAVNDAKNMINNLTNLSDAEKQAFLDNLSSISDETNNMIDSSVTTGDADEATQNAINNIKQYANDQKQAHDDALKASKDDAKVELSNQLHDINLRVGQLTNLSPEQRKIAADTLSNIVNASQNEIDAAIKDGQINDSASLATKNMNDFFNKLKADHDEGLNDDRIVAGQGLGASFGFLSGSLDDLDNLTPDQKQEARAKLNDVLSKYNDQINKGMKTDDINSALNQALNELNHIYDNSKKLNASQNYDYYNFNTFDNNDNNSNGSNHKPDNSQSSGNIKIACTNRRINKSNIFKSVPVAVYTNKSIKLYYDPYFKNRLGWKYSDKDSLNLGRPSFIVRRVMYGKNGKPIAYYVQNMDYKTSNSDSYKKYGWIRATGNMIRGLYYSKAPSKTLVIKAKHGLNYYRKANLSSKVGHYKNGQKLHIKKIVHSGLTTRILLSNGKYVSGNKLLVKIM